MASTFEVDSITAITTDSNITIKGKGSGKVSIGDGNLLFPDSDGSSDQVIKTDGSGVLGFADAGGGGGGGGGYVLIETETVSGSPATVEFTALDTGTYNSYMLVAYNINSAATSNSGDLVFQVGTGGTPTWETSGHDGMTQKSLHWITTYSAFAAGNSGFQLMDGMTSEAGSDGSLTIWMGDLGATGVRKGFRALGSYGVGSGNVSHMVFGGYFTGGTTSYIAITGLRFKFAGGENFDDGTFKLYGLV